MTGGGSSLTIPSGAFNGTSTVNITMSLSPVNYSISRLPEGAQAAGDGLTLDLGGAVPVVPLFVSVLAQLTSSQAAMLRQNPSLLDSAAGNKSMPDVNNTNASHTGNVPPVNSSDNSSDNSSNTENGNDENGPTGGARRLLAENATKNDNITDGNNTQNGTANVSISAVAVYYEVKLHWCLAHSHTSPFYPSTLLPFYPSTLLPSTFYPLPFSTLLPFYPSTLYPSTLCALRSAFEKPCPWIKISRLWP
jgi:hypothetical protein